MSSSNIQSTQSLPIALTASQYYNPFRASSALARLADAHSKRLLEYQIKTSRYVLEEKSPSFPQQLPFSEDLEEDLQRARNFMEGSLQPWLDSSSLGIAGTLTSVYNKLVPSSLQANETPDLSPKFVQLCQHIVALSTLEQKISQRKERNEKALDLPLLRVIENKDIGLNLEDLEYLKGQPLIQQLLLRFPTFQDLVCRWKRCNMDLRILAEFPAYAKLLDDNNLHSRFLAERCHKAHLQNKDQPFLLVDDQLYPWYAPFHDPGSPVILKGEQVTWREIFDEKGMRQKGIDVKEGIGITRHDRLHYDWDEKMKPYLEAGEGEYRFVVRAQFTKDEATVAGMHAWVGYQTPAGFIELGWNPTEEVNPWAPWESIPGTIECNDENAYFYHFRYRREFSKEIPREEFRKAINYLGNEWHKPAQKEGAKPYNWINRNCCHMAKDLGEIHGVEMDINLSLSELLHPMLRNLSSESTLNYLGLQRFWHWMGRKDDGKWDHRLAHPYAVARWIASQNPGPPKKYSPPLLEKPSHKLQ